MLSFVSYVGVGIRLWSTNRSLDHPSAFRDEHIVEGADELGVTVPDQEPHSFKLPGHREVTGLLGDEGTIGVTGRSSDLQSPGADLDEEQHVVRAKDHRFHAEESHATMPSAWERKNSAQVGPSLRGAGQGPLPP